LNKIELEANEDLSYLADASAYADNYWNRVSQANLVEHIDEAKRYVAHGDVRLIYHNLKEFKKLANKFGIMEDEKAGVPRTGYEGIVELRYGRGNYFIYLTPPCVVAGNDRPEHFGNRAWLHYDEVLLLRDLGITIL
jgi:alpha-1,3-mannosyl-glycoprotein beta-1,2-N-acetylglucosaminyltransferase